MILFVGETPARRTKEIELNDQTPRTRNPERARRVHAEFIEEMSARHRRNVKGLEQVGGAVFTLWLAGVGVIVSVVFAAVAVGMVVLVLT